MLGKTPNKNQVTSTNLAASRRSDRVRRKRFCFSIAMDRLCAILTTFEKS